MGRARDKVGLYSRTGSGGELLDYSKVNPMGETEQQPYVIVTAYSGVSLAAAFEVSVGETVHGFGTIQCGFEDQNARELMAVIAGINFVPKRSIVVLRTRSEYIRDGCERFLNSDTRTAPQMHGPFGALWADLPWTCRCQSLHRITVEKANKKEHERCKALAATPEDPHILWHVEQWVVEWLTGTKKASASPRRVSP